MYTLVCVRHGESEWNKSNRFTGWTDVDLSEQGAHEARRAGVLVKEAGLGFKVAFTSVLTRAHRTLSLMLDAMGVGESSITVVRAWQLNERHYGDLQGRNKAEMAERFGEKQVQVWRRSYRIPPPPLLRSDTRHPRHDARYQNIDPDLLPSTESLRDTVARVIPYWQRQMLPHLKAHGTLLVVAHGNSLRALVKHLDNISDSDIIDLNIPTGTPFVYQFSANFSSNGYSYLGADREGR